MSLFDKYISRVGRQLGANRLWVAATGYFNVGDVSGGADGTDITGAQLKLTLLSPATRTSYTVSASTTQAVSVIPIGYGLVNVYGAGAYSRTSVKLPAAAPGATLLLAFPVGLNPSAISIGIGTSASIAWGYSDISCVHLSTNVSGVWIEFECVTANEWQVARGEFLHSNFDIQRSA